MEHQPISYGNLSFIPVTPDSDLREAYINTIVMEGSAMGAWFSHLPVPDAPFESYEPECIKNEIENGFNSFYDNALILPYALLVEDNAAAFVTFANFAFHPLVHIALFEEYHDTEVFIAITKEILAACIPIMGQCFDENPKYDKIFFHPPKVFGELLEFPLQELGFDWDFQYQARNPETQTTFAILRNTFDIYYRQNQ